MRNLILVLVAGLALTSFSAAPAVAHHNGDCHGNSCGDKPDNPNKGPGNNSGGGNGKGHDKNADKPGHVKHGD